MKKRINFLFAVVGVSLFATGCQNESNGSDNIKEGEKTTVSLTITTEQAAKTRGAVGTDPATDKECLINISKNLKVWAFDANGTYKADYSLELTADNNGVITSKTFEINPGDYYFYVFANDDGYLNPNKTSMTNFISSEITTTYAGNCPNIATDNMFLHGTLWKKETTKVEPGRTSDNPQVITLEIGRLASKVCLESIPANIDNGILKGSFSENQFRLGTIPKKITTVGRHEGDKLPVNNNDDVMVKSCVHEVPHLINPDKFNENDFVQYSGWCDIKSIIYTTENTTNPVSNVQYFGNVTYVQVKTKYTPDPAKIYEPENLASNQILTDGNFWTAKLTSTGARLIFNSKPTSPNANPDIDLNSIVEYAGGINYHKFPIFDPKETDAVKRNRVLRNHSYIFSVTKFNDLGSSTEDVNPAEVIPAKTTVQIKVEVLPWEKVVGSVEL